MTEPSPDQPQSTPSTSSAPPVRPADRGPRSNPFWLGVLTVVALGLAVGALSLAALSGSFTINLTTPNANATGVTVSSTATIHAVPDMATVNFGISSTAPTIRLVRAQTADAANRVIAALGAAGVAEADIATTNISLYQNNPYPYPVTDPSSPCYRQGGIMIPAPLPAEPPTLVTPVASPDSSALPVPSGAPATPASGFSSGGTSGAAGSGQITNGGPAMIVPLPPVSPNPTASAAPAASGGDVIVGSQPIILTGPSPIIPINSACAPSWVYSESLSVTINDLNIASDVIDGAVKAGATSVDSLSFDVSNRAALESQARTKAITEARTQAAAMATAAGGTLGNPVSINASFSGPISPATPMAMSAAGRSTTTPVSPGTMDITAQVTVIFDFKQ